MKDETKNAILRLPYIMMTTHDYLDYLTYLEENKPKGLSFDEDIQAEPFYHNEYDARIIAYRKHLLKAIEFQENEVQWVKINEFLTVEDIITKYFIEEASDNDFMERIQQLTTIDFKGE